MRITNTAIRAMEYKGGWDVRWDDAISGFGVRLFASGKKSYVLSYRIHSRKRTITIGQVGKITLEQARKQAMSLSNEVSQGQDPAQRKQAQSKLKTMKELCNTYINDYAKAYKKTWQQDKRRIDLYILPQFGARKVADIAPSDIERLHKAIGKDTPYEANRLLALLSVIFEKAADWGYVDGNLLNPTRRIKKYRETKRDRWVTPEEMPRLIAAIQEEENLYARQLILMYLLTGARKSELMNAKWEDVSWQQETLRLADTKAGRVFYIALSQEAIRQLKCTPKLHGNPYVFAGRNQGEPIKDIKKAWERIRTKAGLKDVRLHDLRRTVGSWLANSGESLHLIGNVLNHSNPSTTAVYARFGDAARHRAIEKHGERIAEYFSD